MAEVIEQVTNKVVTATCDKCGRKTRLHRKCAGCGIDICPSCTAFIHRDPWSGADNGDYPERACQSCFELMIPFAKEAQQTLDAAFEKTDELRQQWIAACKHPKTLPAAAISPQLAPDDGAHGRTAAGRD